MTKKAKCMQELLTTAKLLPIANSPENILSHREYEILLKMAEDRSTKQIAYFLNIEACTVRTYINNIMHKFGVASREMVLAAAIKYGFLKWEE